MLDNKAELLLEYISNYCGAEYKIITVKELQNALPSYLNSTEETIKNLRFIKDDGSSRYIYLDEVESYESISK
jgi:hypothetical protein